MDVVIESRDGRNVAPAGRMSLARKDRLFFTGMALLALATVLTGFSRSYFLKGYFAAPALSGLLHVHGALFTAWILFFVLQNGLVASRLTRVHRKIGVAGGGLAAAMLIAGTLAAVDAAERGAAPPGMSPLAFLAIPLTDMVVFPALVAVGLYYRNRPDTHKRLMLAATVNLLPAAIARLPFAFILPAGPIAFFGLADLFLLACVAYDRLTRGRVHPAFIWAGLLTVASQILRVVVAGTDAWLAIAARITAIL